MISKASEVDEIFSAWRPESVYGRVIAASGKRVKATMPRAALGDNVRIEMNRSSSFVEGEVTAVLADHIVIAPLEDIRGVSSGSRVFAVPEPPSVLVDESLLGSVVDYSGMSLYGGEAPPTNRVSIYRKPPHPMERPLISVALPTGVKAIDGVNTVGKGQRIGIFAPAATGKSTLLGMIAKGARADVTVIALIGERGREVREFLEVTVPPEVRSRAIVVVATSERSAVERVRAAYAAITIAEYFRDRGNSVVLLFDSLTRVARALREIALGVGELPARFGYPPSVYERLPEIVERVGLTKTGSITGFFSLLVEGEESADPITEEVKSLLDGHLSLSRELASAGRFPAIDVLASVSRCMTAVATPQHVKASLEVRRLLSRYTQLEFLLKVGEYKPGSDRDSDLAIARYPEIVSFLKQGLSDIVSLDASRTQVQKLAGLAP